LIAVVVLPTPPFWLAIAITFVTGASPRSLALALTWGARRRQSGRCAGPDRPVDRSAATGPRSPLLIHRIAELCTEVWISRRSCPGSLTTRFGPFRAVSEDVIAAEARI